MTTATLGFAINSSQASSAAVDLTKLDAVAAKLDQTADNLAASVKALGTAMGQAGNQASNTTAPVERLGRTFRQQDTHVAAFRAEIERLTMKYKPLEQATRSYTATVSEIERAHKLGIINADQMTRALEQERMAYERLKTSAMGAGTALQAANRNNAARNERFAGINAGYQFQDIAVTAAMGMNPMMIALQQGTQLSSVVSSMERPVAGMVAAIGSMINPVSLITIGLTAAAAAAIQYFSNWNSEADEANDQLAEQADLIRSLADRWGEAIPSLTAYADELERAQTAAELKQTASLLNERTLAPIKTNIEDITVSFADLIIRLQSATDEQAAVLKLQDAFSQFEEAASDGSVTLDEVKSVQDALAAALTSTGIPAISDFASEFDKLAEAARAAAGEVGNVNSQAGAVSGGKITQMYPSQGDYGRFAPFQSPDFTIQGQRFPLPEYGPVPGSRPNIELSGDGTISTEAAMIVNSDGKLVAVPIPNARPNFFEQQEATTPSWSSGGRASWSRSVLQEEATRLQVGGEFKGFFQSFRQELESNGGDLGKALMTALSNAAMSVADKAFDRLFDMLSTAAVNALMGAPSQGLLNKGIGFTGANTTLGAFLGGAGGVFPTSGSSMPVAANSNLSAYARAIQSIESGGNYSALGPVTRSGDRAYGAYQVMGANIGPWSKEALGRSISTSEFLANPSLQDQIFNNKFGGYVGKYGPSGAAQAWFGGPGSVGGSGMGADILGTTGNAYVEKFNSALGDATSNLGTFGGGLDKFGTGLSGLGSNLASGASGGGGGGLFGWLGGLFGGGKSQWSLAASGAITGLFADGTNSAPGGLAIVGEKGPELVDLPQGSKVFPNGKSMEMLAANANNTRTEKPQLNVYVQGANTDAQIRMMAQQGADEALARYSETQVRGGFGTQQEAYNKRKG